MESVCTGNRTVGSNPTLSANLLGFIPEVFWSFPGTWVTLPASKREGAMPSKVSCVVDERLRFVPRLIEDENLLGPLPRAERCAQLQL